MSPERLKNGPFRKSLWLRGCRSRDLRADPIHVTVFDTRVCFDRNLSPISRFLFIAITTSFGRDIYWSRCQSRWLTFAFTDRPYFESQESRSGRKNWRRPNITIDQRARVDSARPWEYPVYNRTSSLLQDEDALDT